MAAPVLMRKLAAHPYPAPGYIAPDTDGWFLPQSMERIYAEGRQAHIPLLAGWNRDEPSALSVNDPQPPTPTSFGRLARQQFGLNADRFLRLFPTRTEAETIRSAIDFSGDRFVVFSTWAWLAAQAATGQPVYRYRFDRPAPADPKNPAGSGAFHSDEVVYVFGTLDTRIGAHWRPADYRLSALMQTYWTNFARTGNPDGSGAVPWPRYNAADHWQVLYLNAQTHSAPDAQRPQFLFLQSVWERQP